VHQGTDLWSHQPFSERWLSLLTFWNSLPPDQPLLAFQPRLVQPIALSDWHLHYNPAIYWIIQPDHMRQARWYWKDVITVPEHRAVEFIAPILKRSKEMAQLLCAYCIPYAKMVLPDTYSLLSQEGNSLGMASIPTLLLSLELRGLFSDKTNASVRKTEGIPVEVEWNAAFQKYQVVRVLPQETPITTEAFFHHMRS
jgi:hypothetical protein